MTGIAPPFPLPLGNDPEPAAAPATVRGPGTVAWRSLRRWWRLAAAALDADRERWALWLPVAMGVGALCYFGLRVEPPRWIGTVAILSAVGWLVVIRRSVALHAAAAGMLAAALGFAAAQWQCARMPPMPTLPKRAVVVDGTVAAVDPLPDGSRRVLVGAATLREAPAVPRRAGRGSAAVEDRVPGGGGGGGGAAVDGERTRRAFRIRLRAGDAAAPLSGDRITLRAMLRPPAAPDWPGGRDGQREAFFSGLGGSGFALSPATVIAVPAGGLRRVREAAAARIMAVLPGVRGAVAATLMTGLGTAISQTDRDAFAASGLAHILAVAGLHLGIVMALALFVARFALANWEWGALRLPCRQIAAGTALAAGGVYMAMTGLHLPGLRSLLMATVVVLGLVLGRRTVSLRGLGLAAAVILLVQPAQILDVAFQMSFAAVLALLAGYEAARPWSAFLAGTGTRWHRARLHLFQLFFTSLLAGAASLPYAAFHFGRMQFYFVLANLLAVPVTAAVVMPAGVLAMLGMPLGLDRLPLRVMGGGIDLVIALARGVTALPAASLPVPAMPVWGLLVGTFGLLWLCVWRRSWRLLGVLPMLLGLFSPWLARPPDLLVSADAGVVALRDGDRVLALLGSRADAATTERDWLRDWGLPAGAAPGTGFAPFPEAEVSGGMTCNPAACLLGRRGDVLLLRPPPTAAGGARAPAGIEPGDCDGVLLLVSPAPADGICPGVRRIDRFTVWRDGPQAVWIRGRTVRVWDARDARGARPWVPPDPAARRPRLKLATAE